MVKESTGDNKAERDAVVHAINALKARGCDINPYSVAEEANISRSSLVRSTELMRLLSDARSGKNGNNTENAAETIEELLARNETLVHELGQLQWEAGVLRRYFQEAQAENKKLHEEVVKTKEEAANIAKSINVAWQQGYIAGQQTVEANPIMPQKSLVESLKEAAEAATADGARHAAPQAVAAPVAEQPAEEKVPAATAAAAPTTASPPATGGRPGRTYPQQQQQAPAAAPEPADRQSTIPPPPVDMHTTTPLPSPADVHASMEDTYEGPAYVAPEENAAPNNNGSQEAVDPSTDVGENPLHIEDPEVLNDPFTAKLLSALAAEDDEDEESEMTAQNEVIITPPPGATRSMTAEDLVLRAAQEQVDLSYHLDETQEVRALTAEDLAAPLPAELLAEMAKPALRPSQEPAVSSVPESPQSAAQPAPSPQPEPVAVGGSPLAELAGADTGEVEKPTGQQSQPAPEPEPVAAGSPHAEPRAEGAEHHDDEDEEGDARIRSRYNADELHSLFRNRFVRTEEQAPEQPAPPPKVLENSQGTKKFVGSKHSTTEPVPAVARAFPPEIRKACRLLGLTPEEGITKQMVLESWKKEMSKPGVHPDTGGDTEMAIYLNTAKDALLRWVEANAPKLGKKFGQPKNAGDQSKPKE
jgi:hypothetical protein